MPYQLASSSFKLTNDKVFQEDFLQDLENQKFLIVSKDLETNKTEIYETNWSKEPDPSPATLPIAINLPQNNQNELGLKNILEASGINPRQLTQIKKEITLATHTPPFHADDLMAVALMRKYFISQGIPTKVIQTRDQETINKADAVVDVGGELNKEKMRFDHHQIKNSDKAATGLVAEFLREKKGFEWVDKLASVINKIDKADLGKPENPADLKIGEVLNNFNPTWKEAQGQQFFKALSILEECLDNTLALETIETSPNENLSNVFEENLLNHNEVKQRQKDVEEAKIEGNELFIKSAIEGRKTGIAITKQGIDFYNLLTKSYIDNSDKETKLALKSINYIVFETTSGAKNAIAAPTPENRMSQKHPFPQDWRGKRGQELVDAISKSTGVNFPPITQEKANEYFCHNAGFFLTLPSIHKNTFDAAISYCAKTAQRLESIDSKIGKLREDFFEKQTQKMLSKKEDKLQNRDAWGRGGPL